MVLAQEGLAIVPTKVSSGRVLMVLVTTSNRREAVSVAEAVVRKSWPPV